jgi:hypothetical protein
MMLITKSTAVIATVAKANIIVTFLRMLSFLGGSAIGFIGMITVAKISLKRINTKRAELGILKKKRVSAVCPDVVDLQSVVELLKEL